jgi:hypothetical protein
VKIFFLPLFLLSFSACQSKQAELLFPRRPQIVRNRHEWAGKERGGGNTAALIRQPEIVKVYGMNRYIDPGDSSVMHERHAIYRLEQQPSWITHSPSVRNELILGPVVGLKKPEYAPEPLPGETARGLTEAKRNALQAHQEIDTMRDGQSKLVSSVESLAKETVEAERRLASAISGLNERVGHLEGGSSSERLAPDSSDAQDAAVVIHPSNR